MLVLLVSGCLSQPVSTPTPARQLASVALLVAPRLEHEHYYILVFGAQRLVPLPRFTHTWATVVRTIEPPGGPVRVTEVQTISWMPATLQIHPQWYRVEKGTNLDLDTTLEEVLRNREHVWMWGPYETWHGHYQRFLTQKAFLESGAIGYQCADALGEAARAGNGCNCFHALSDMDPHSDRSQHRLLLYGNQASLGIVRRMFEEPVLIHPQQTHDHPDGG